VRGMYALALAVLAFPSFIGPGPARVEPAAKIPSIPSIFIS